MNNNTKSRFKSLTRFARATSFRQSNKRNRWNTVGKVGNSSRKQLSVRKEHALALATLRTVESNDSFIITQVLKTA